MRTGLNSKLVLAALALLATFTANAHVISGGPDAPAHNLSHTLPMLGLAALAGLVAFAAYHCFKRR